MCRSSIMLSGYHLERAEQWDFLRGGGKQVPLLSPIHQSCCHKELWRCILVNFFRCYMFYQTECCFFVLLLPFFFFFLSRNKNYDSWRGVFSERLSSFLFPFGFLSSWSLHTLRVLCLHRFGTCHRMLIPRKKINKIK